MRRAAAALAGLVPALGLAAAAAAQDDETARRQLVPGLDLRPTIAVTGGYDSNPREEPQGAGSAFAQIDVGLRASLGEEDATQAVLSLQGSLAAFVESGEAAQHELLAELEIGHAVSEALRLSLGASYQRDDRDDPPTTYAELWGQAEADLGRLDLELRGAVAEYRERVSRADVVELDLEIYDYRTATAALRAALDSDRRLAPLLRGRVAAIDYLERRPGKPERDALEHSVMAGAAVTVSDALFVELGLRRTERVFDAPGVGSHARLGPDVEVTWRPTDELRLTAAYGHAFSEPSEEAVRVVDASIARLDVEYAPGERLALNAGVALAEQKAIGTGGRTRRWDAHADARWLLRERLYLIAAARYEEEAPREGEGYRRVIVRAGLESTF